MTQSIGLTTRFSITSTSLGSRKDIVNRRVATDLGSNPEFVERTFILPPNNSGGSNSASKRQFPDVRSYFMIHADFPLTLKLTDAEGNSSLVPMEDFFIVTASFAEIEAVNLSQTDTASVSVVCA